MLMMNTGTFERILQWGGCLFCVWLHKPEPIQYSRRHVCFFFTAMLFWRSGHLFNHTLHGDFQDIIHVEIWQWNFQIYLWKWCCDRDVERKSSNASMTRATSLPSSTKNATRAWRDHVHSHDNYCRYITYWKACPPSRLASFKHDLNTFVYSFCTSRRSYTILLNWTLKQEPTVLRTRCL